MNPERSVHPSHRGGRYGMVVVACIVALIMYCLFTGPLLFNLNTGPMGGDTRLAIFNPLRDRAPEQAAEAFLELLKLGRCQEALATQPESAESRRIICENESKYPLVSWRLRTREDGPQKSALSFWYRRAGYAEEERLFVWVEERGGHWQVTGYKSTY